MKKSVYHFIIASLFLAFSPISLLAESSIKDPAITKRCKELEKNLLKKVRFKERIDSFLVKVEHNKSILKPTQKKVSEKLERIHKKLAFQRTSTQSRIDSISEQIIKAGCPPISYKDQLFETASTKDQVKRNFRELNINEIDLQSIEDEEAAN